MIWQFLINSIEVDEPVGWSDVSWSAQRNLDTHGVWFSVKADAFKFVGDAFTALNDEYELNGAEGVASFQINYSCDNGETFDTFFLATFDFNTYRRTCGDMCYAECSVNPTGCVNKFLNRINVDVDMESTVDLDGNAITPAALDNISLEPQELLFKNRATNSTPTYWDSGIFSLDGTPGTDEFNIGLYFPDPTLEGWGVFNPYGAIGSLVFNTNYTTYEWFNMVNFPGVRELSIYQRDLDVLNCFDSDATINFRIKGNFLITEYTSGLTDVTITINFAKFYVSGYSTSAPYIVIDSYAVAPPFNMLPGVTSGKPFDYIFSNTPAYTNPDADFLLIFFSVSVNRIGASTGIQVQIDYAPETFFEMSYNSMCSPTTAEGIRLDNAFCNIWENYLGSEECGISCELPACLQNIHLTNGLKIRQVLTPQPARIFLNWEDTFKNLQKIFNIGYGFFDSESSFTVNSLDFWYAGNTVLNLGSAREVRFSNATGFAYGVINVGYSKYELEDVQSMLSIASSMLTKKSY